MKQQHRMIDILVTHPPSISRTSSFWFQRLEEKRYRKELFYILKKITKNYSGLFLPGWPSHISLLWREGEQELCGQIAADLPVELKGSSIVDWTQRLPLGSTHGSMELLSVVSSLGFAGEFVVILGFLLPLSCLREHLVVFSATVMKADERLLSRARGLRICHAYT